MCGWESLGICQPQIVELHRSFQSSTYGLLQARLLLHRVYQYHAHYFKCTAMERAVTVALGQAACVQEALKKAIKLAAAPRRLGPTPHLGSTVELALMTGAEHEG